MKEKDMKKKHPVTQISGMWVDYKHRLYIIVSFVISASDAVNII